MSRKLIATATVIALSLVLTLSTLNAQEVQPPVNNIPIPESLPGSILTPEETRNALCFAYLVSEYKKTTAGWGASTEILGRVPQKNFLVARNDVVGNIWPKQDETDRWRELLRLVNFGESTDVKEYPNAKKVYVILSQSGVIADPWRLSKGGEVVIIFFWGKDFCQLEFIGNRKIDSFQAGESFLDSWINPLDKNYNSPRSIVEKKWRIVGLSIVITRLNFLADADHSNAVHHCRSERVAEGEMANCAELLWQYELKPIQALIDATSKLFGDNDLGRPNYLPKDIEGFFREANGNKAIVRFLRYKMKYWYDRDNSPEYNPPLGKQIEALRAEIEAVMSAMSENQSAKVAELQSRLDVLTHAQTQFDKYAAYWEKCNEKKCK
ncbi:MAG: phasin family protein [bacterium]|nr:phasin family protein [bacterium]